MDPGRAWTSTRADQLSLAGQNCWPSAGLFVIATGQVSWPPTESCSHERHCEGKAVTGPSRATPEARLPQELRLVQQPQSARGHMRAGAAALRVLSRDGSRDAGRHKSAGGDRVAPQWSPALGGALTRGSTPASAFRTVRFPEWVQTRVSPGTPGRLRTCLHPSVLQIAVEDVDVSGPLVIPRQLVFDPLAPYSTHGRPLLGAVEQCSDELGIG